MPWLLGWQWEGDATDPDAELRCKTVFSASRQAPPSRYGDDAVSFTATPLVCLVEVAFSHGQAMADAAESGDVWDGALAALASAVRLQTHCRCLVRECRETRELYATTAGPCADHQRRAWVAFPATTLGLAAMTILWRDSRIPLHSVSQCSATVLTSTYSLAAWLDIVVPRCIATKSTPPVELLCCAASPDTDSVWAAWVRCTDGAMVSAIEPVKRVPAGAVCLCWTPNDFRNHVVDTDLTPCWAVGCASAADTFGRLSGHKSRWWSVLCGRVETACHDAATLLDGCAPSAGITGGQVLLQSPSIRGWLAARVAERVVGGILPTKTLTPRVAVASALGSGCCLDSMAPLPLRNPSKAHAETTTWAEARLAAAGVELMDDESHTASVGSFSGGLLVSPRPDLDVPAVPGSKKNPAHTELPQQWPVTPPGTVTLELDLNALHTTTMACMDRFRVWWAPHSVHPTVPQRCRDLLRQRRDADAAQHPATARAVKDLSVRLYGVTDVYGPIVSAVGRVVARAMGAAALNAARALDGSRPGWMVQVATDAVFIAFPTQPDNAAAAESVAAAANAALLRVSDALTDTAHSDAVVWRCKVAGLHRRTLFVPKRPPAKRGVAPPTLPSKLECCLNRHCALINDEVSLVGVDAKTRWWVAVECCRAAAGVVLRHPGVPRHDALCRAMWDAVADKIEDLGGGMRPGTAALQWWCCVDRNVGWILCNENKGERTGMSSKRYGVKIRCGKTSIADVDLGAYAVEVVNVVHYGVSPWSGKVQQESFGGAVSRVRSALWNVLCRSKECL
jgi:hypothetical protein